MPIPTSPRPSSAAARRTARGAFAALAVCAAAAGLASAHEVTSVLPPAGASGQAVIVSGSGFSAGGRKPKVYLTRTALPGAKRAPRTPLKVTAFDDDSIDAVLGKLTRKTPPGTYDFHVDVRGQPGVVLQGGFAVTGVELLSIQPERAQPGDEITISAAGNGTKKGRVFVQDPRGRKIPLKVSEWLPGTIRVKLPKNLPIGDYSVSLQNTISSDVLSQALAVGNVLESEFLTFSSDVFPDYAADDGFPQARVVESAQFISQVGVSAQFYGPNHLDVRQVGFTLFFDGAIDDLELPRTFTLSSDGSPVDGSLAATISDLVFPPVAVPVPNAWSSELGSTFTVTVTKVEQAAIEGTFEGSLVGDSQNTLAPMIATSAGEFRAVIMSRQTAP